MGLFRGRVVPSTRLSLEVQKMAWLIIVTGPPASGKSTLATWLGQQLSLPVIGKDGIKEIMFAEMGWQDREWSKLLGRASVEIMYHLAHTLLGANTSLILENAFHPELASPKLQTIIQQHQARAIQIICQAPAELLFQRFRQRAETGQRHEGHVDLSSLAELQASLQPQRPVQLQIEGSVIPVDTTDFAMVAYETILEQVSRLMNDGR